MPSIRRLLVFNLLTDADDPVLGFTTVWLNALAQRCEAIDVVTMQAGRLALADNVRVYSVGKERGYSEPRRALEFYRILFRLLRHHRYDACFAHMMPLFALMGAPLLAFWRVPVTLWHAHKVVSRILWLAEKTVRHVVTASTESFRLPSEKTLVIGHGVDTGLFHPVPRLNHDRFTIVSVGRTAPVKRLETIIEAVALLSHEQAIDNLCLRLVGGVYPQDVAYGERLRQQVNELGLKNMVEFPGGVPYEEVVEVYQQADLMVNMSATGAIDKAVLEAMACGLPVITSNEAFRNILAPWADRLLATPDAPDKLAMQIKAIAAMEREEWAALGAELRALVVAQHSLERLVDQLVTLFQSDQK